MVILVILRLMMFRRHNMEFYFDKNFISYTNFLILHHTGSKLLVNIGGFGVRRSPLIWESI